MYEAVPEMFTETPHKGIIPIIWIDLSCYGLNLPNLLTLATRNEYELSWFCTRHLTLSSLACQVESCFRGQVNEYTLAQLLLHAIILRSIVGE